MADYMLSVRIPEPLRKKLEHEAAGMGLSLSYYVRHVLGAHLDAVERFLNGKGDRPPTMPSW